MRTACIFVAVVDVERDHPKRSDTIRPVFNRFEFNDGFFQSRFEQRLHSKQTVSTKEVWVDILIPFDYQLIFCGHDKISSCTRSTSI